MAKNIDVKGHVERYRDTDPKQIQQLIEGLTGLIEEIRVETIRQYEEKLMILKSGIIPEPQEAVLSNEKPKRSRKKKGETTEQEIIDEA